MHRWLDALIADAEQRLRELTQHPAHETADAEALATVEPGASDAPPWERARHARQTFPFDERAPRQRPGA